MTDSSGALLAWNAAAAELLGLGGRRLRGQCCWKVFAGIDVDGNPYCGPTCALTEAVRQRRPLHRFSVHLRHRDGHALTVRAVAVALPLDADGIGILHLLSPCPAVAPTADDRGTAMVPAIGASPPPLTSVLTSRQHDVLRLIAEGRATAEIARLRCVSVATVRNHVRQLLARLGVHTRIAAVAEARARGLL